MRVFVTCCLVMLGLGVRAAHPLEGRWVGGIDSDRGQMQIGLQLKADKGTLTGALETPHGDWPVTGVTENKGTYTVTFSTGNETGTLSGTITHDTFSGEWKNGSVSRGTFSLSRAADKT